MSWINKLESLDQQLIILLNGNNNIFLDEFNVVYFKTNFWSSFLYFIYLFIFQKLQFQKCFTE